MHIRSEQGTDAVFVVIPGPLLVKVMSQAEGIVRSKKAAATRRCSDPRVIDNVRPTGMGRLRINERQQPYSDRSQPIRYKRMHPQSPNAPEPDRPP